MSAGSYGGPQVEYDSTPWHATTKKVKLIQWCINKTDACQTSEVIIHFH